MNESAPNSIAAGQWNWMVQPKDCLFTDEDLDQREQRAEQKSDGVGKQPDQSRLEKDQPTNLSLGGPEEAQNADLAPAVDHERHERAGHAKYGYDDGNHFQGVGDRKGAVEDLQGACA